MIVFKILEHEELLMRNNFFFVQLIIKKFFIWCELQETHYINDSRFMRYKFGVWVKYEQPVTNY